jgi:hypothetical protein
VIRQIRQRHHSYENTGRVNLAAHRNCGDPAHHYCLARLAFLIALRPENVIALWLPSAFALTAATTFDHRIVVGVWFGLVGAFFNVDGALIDNGSAESG